jgi:hypothetical protein
MERSVCGNQVKRILANSYFIKRYLPFILAGVIICLNDAECQPVLGKEHGFFTSPFTLTISGTQGNSQIRYTTDCSFPSATHGTIYSGPLTISKTSVIRAVEIVNGIPGKIATATYIFPGDVIHQPNNPAGYPAKWGPYTGISGQAIADYEMDPELMADPAFAASAADALLDIPAVSIVTDRNYLFSNSQNPDTGGIYIYTGPPLTNTTNGLGFGWERPASFEMFDPGDSVSLQLDCGLRLEGGHSRRPEKNPKHSFRLVFRSKYGPSKLNFPLFGPDAVQEFNTIILRGGFGNTWVHWSVTERQMASYLRDRWSKDSHLAMGHIGSHGFFVHLYLNGIYWGVYNPSERLDADFAESYLAGDAGDIDIIKDYAEVVDGNIKAWDAMMTTANAGLSGESEYERFIGNRIDGTADPGSPAWVDPVSLADYMLLNFYGGNWDWDHHNWVAMRNRVNPGRGFRFFCWDEEHMVETVNANILSENNDNCPSRIFQQLLKNQTFRRLFADRIQKFCFNDGALTAAPAAARWIYRAGQIDKAIIDESARWGDYRRDVHPWQTGPYDLYTKEKYWLPEMGFMTGTYFPQRTNEFIRTLRVAGLFPMIDAPVFLLNGMNQFSSIISGGEMLTMNAAGSTIYYTSDGSDPVDWKNNSVPSKNSKRYTSGFRISGSMHIKARALQGNSWSATAEKLFILPDDYKNLKLTEINYNPKNSANAQGKELEFIEFKNTGKTTLCLRGSRVSGGIKYLFEPDVALRPGEFIVLASDPSAFSANYGFLPYDMYSGNLGNDGEKIILTTAEGDTIINVSYFPGSGWPVKANGQGYTLVPVETNPVSDQNLAESWRASNIEGGSPGRDDIYVADNNANDILRVYHNYPNPISRSTTLAFDLLKEGEVTIEILSPAGSLVRKVEMGKLPEGYCHYDWDAAGEKNRGVSSGIYFWRITASCSGRIKSVTSKMLVIK